jgi:hypothetical protein
MKLKRAKDIDWQDLPMIEAPFFAKAKIERVFFNRYSNISWGIDKVLYDSSLAYYGQTRDHRSLKRLLQMLEDGEVFLVHGWNSKPFSPVVRWESDGNDKSKGRWQVLQSNHDLSVKWRLKWIVRTLSRERHGDNVPESSLWDQVVGGAKEVVNQVVDSNRAQANEWFAEEGVFHYTDKSTGRKLSPREVAKHYRNDSPPTLKPEGAGEEDGAQMVRDNPHAPLLIGAISTLVGRGRSELRNPDEFFADLRRVLSRTRSKTAPETEALGELGLAQAQRRLGVKNDSRYINRYHGPDDITKKDNKLGEWEGKGSKDNQVRVAKDKKNRRQGSKDKNRKRAETMTKKEQQGKVGQPSNRQGGPYTEGEMKLWKEIRARDGNKQHLLVHTNTTTGKARVFEQVNGGKIGKQLDEFEIENFEVAKEAIKEYFKK